MTSTYTSTDPAVTFECRHDLGTTVAPRFVDCTPGKTKIRPDGGPDACDVDLGGGHLSPEHHHQPGPAG